MRLVVAARRMSPGARDLAARNGIGWVDESGAAEIALPEVIVSRSGRPDERPSIPRGWTPAGLTVAEALLTGTPATVAACVRATGLSSGTCTQVLALLAKAGLLDAPVGRGPRSGRRVADRGRLLEEYATAHDALRSDLSLACGVLWRERPTQLAELARRWQANGVACAATGEAAAELLAPLVTQLEVVEVLVAVRGLSGLSKAAKVANLRPIDGGRLILRPFTALASARLVREVDRVPLAPWPAVYVDLRRTGVRGEEAAEHLREILDAS